MNTAPSSVDAAWAVLEGVCDPEIPVLTLREMGILRDVRAAADGLEVVITPTYSGCPAMEQIEDDVRAALAAAGLVARVKRQLAPAWTTDWMSETAREKLRAYGIAPPAHAADGGPRASTAPAAGAGACATAGAQVIRRRPQAARQEARVPCPRCGSSHTVETSHFGSTACKALFRCLDCREPFDHFKPY